MRLTRRDALAALAVAGATAGVGIGVMGPDADSEPSGPVGSAEIATLVATAEVLYPDEVGGIDRFVEGFVRGRVEDRPEHGEAVASALDYLEAYTDAWYDRSFVDLEPSAREEALRRMNVPTARPDPDGSDVERVRYFVVNELLFALYASPTGGDLVGLENPQGHPGGRTSYRRGPRS